MAKRLTPEERRARWEKRAEKLTETVPKSFRGAMQNVHRMSRLELARTVYSQSKPGRRSGALKNSEVLEHLSDSEAVIKNTAYSEWGGVRTYYGWVVAFGHDALDKGRKYYAWMVDPRQPRPQTLNIWLQCRRMGVARMAHRIRAMKGRNWRAAAINLAQKQQVVIGALRKGVREVMRDADRVDA